MTPIEFKKAKLNAMKNAIRDSRKAIEKIQETGHNSFVKYNQIILIMAKLDMAIKMIQSQSYEFFKKEGVDAFTSNKD